MTPSEVSTAARGLLNESVPQRLRQAAMLCAVPNWFTRSLGLHLIDKFGRPMGSAEQVFGELVCLPFVYRREDVDWQVAPSIRAVLKAQLSEQGQAFQRVSSFVARDLTRQVDQAFGLRARSLQAEIVYHMAVTRPRVALQELVRISDAAARESHVANIKLAVDTCTEQSQWLPSGDVEVLYVRGRYAYATDDWKAAQVALEEVWRRKARDPFVTANAGLLLGVLYRRRGQQPFLDRAEVTLRQTLTLCEKLLTQDRRRANELRAWVLNSLGATIAQRGAAGRFDEAERMLRQSLSLGERVGDKQHRAQVLNTLGTLYAEAGGVSGLRRAERCFRQALLEEPVVLDAKSHAQLEHSLGKVLSARGDYANLREAESHLRRSLDLGKRVGKGHHTALALQTLGLTLIRLGGAKRRREAEEYLRRSFAFWKSVDHVQGQEHSLRALETLMVREKRADDLLAIRSSLAELSSRKS